MDLSKVSLTNFGLGISGSIVTQSFQSSQLHLNWKLLRWYENQFEKLQLNKYDNYAINYSVTNLLCHKSVTRRSVPYDDIVLLLTK